MRKKRYGRCRLCLKFRRLTKEHVPPASAFNEGEYRRYYVDESEKAELLRWEAKDVSANGIFVFSLCEACNQKTGRAYASAYASFVEPFAGVATPENVDQEVEVEFRDFSPVRVVKQAVSMILSTSNPGFFNGYKAVGSPLVMGERPPRSMDVYGPLPDQQRLREVYAGLRAFVNNRALKGLPPSVRLYTYATANRGSGVQTGILANASLTTQKVFWGVVVGLWPIHWVLALAGEPHTPLLDVTDWANEDYKTKRKLTVRMPCRWTYAKYPLDFRTPEKFRDDGFVARMRVAGYLPESGADEERVFQGAVEFARRRGTLTSDGIFLKQFQAGTFAEYKGRMMWFEDWRLREVREALREWFACERTHVAHPDKSTADKK